MKHYQLAIFLVLAGSMALQFCTTTRSAGTAKDKSNEGLVTYSKDVAPILAERCTPCHYPPEGKKQFLHTYIAVSENIVDIISRVELPKDDDGFMPFKEKKEPLSDSLIQVLKTWHETGMAE